MALDPATCRKARLARDARFDGRFFVAVRTTGVFCRPVCPAVTPAERNVAYFDTAAAASEAGFRACLRCRPECAPGTPAWAGASTTVTRALRLIGDGAVDVERIDDLAIRLGVGTRHLRRLFVEHLGASPIAVAQVRRLLSAKRLIDETDLPLTTVALSAGYRSIRRFNAAFLGSYGRSPRQLRDAGRRQAAGRRLPPVPADTGAHTAYSFQLRYRPPYSWERMLAFLGPRATRGVELVEGSRYTRTIEAGGGHGWLDVEPGGVHALRLVVRMADPLHLLQVVSRARRMFDLDADPMAIAAALRGDPLLAPLVRRHPGVRVPGAWSGYELGVRAILGQQVSVAAATTLAGRLVEAFGRRVDGEDGDRTPTHLFPTAEVVADAPVERVGLPTARARAIRGFADAVAAGRVSFGVDADPADVRRALRSLPGIGDWTAEYIALRALGDPDAFPSSDLGLLRAAGLSSPRALAERAEAWRPWRAYAAIHLWEAGS
jgi:AraC family transcriptional regulator, regulatory protein of adaptative response / DNA-3-methyladenine glycosylase II